MPHAELQDSHRTKSVYGIRKIAQTAQLAIGMKAQNPNSILVRTATVLHGDPPGPSFGDRHIMA
jgi:hypothetical protein